MKDISQQICSSNKVKRIITSSVLGLAVLATATNSYAISYGTDLNLTMHPAAGGMGGAAYTLPQEASAAVFGNPATLTQFKGINFNFGASYIRLQEVKNVQTSTIPGVGTFQNESESVVDDYVTPAFGASLELMPGLVLGLGLEVDAGIGTDWRTNPIQLIGGAGGALLGSPASIPLVVELISLNVNVAAAFQVTDQLSVGAAVTIGEAFAQLGTAGPTTGLTALGAALDTGALAGAGFLGLTDFGGTTADTHDVGIGLSLGAVFEAMPGISLSGVVKSKVGYDFENIIYTTVGGIGWQDMPVEQPLEIIFGVGIEDVLVPGLLVEADVNWKNWSHADTYEDVYDDQFILALGAQYSGLIPGLDLRAGYSYSENPLLDTPNNTLGGLNGVGSIPLGAAADGAGPAFSGLATDVVRIVQMTLLPVSWEHTFTVGAGYNFNKAVRLDLFGAFAVGEDRSRGLTTVDAALGSLGLVGSSTTNAIELDTEYAFGLGLNIALP